MKFCSRLNEDYNDYLVSCYILQATKFLLTFAVNMSSIIFLFSICFLNILLPKNFGILCLVLKNFQNQNLICYALVIYCVYQIIFHLHKITIYFVKSILAYDTWSVVKDFQNSIKTELSIENTNKCLLTESCFAVIFSNVSFSIRSERKILQDLHFLIEAKEKMGKLCITKICGLLFYSIF